MANVSTEGMNAAAGSISGAAASAQAAIESMKAEANKIIELCGRIEGFNGQYVTGYEPKTLIRFEDYAMADGSIGQRELRFRYYKKWNVSSPGGISAAVSSIISELESLEASLADFGAAATEIEGRSDVIDGYISAMMSQLGDNIDQSTLMGAFRAGGLAGALKLHIAYDAEQAANGQFIAEDKILSEYWTDKPLSFKRQENGTYAIYQEDDNGNQVLMGFTTGVTALGYMTSLGKASGVMNKNSNDNLVQMVANDEKSKSNQKNPSMDESIIEEKKKDRIAKNEEALKEAKKKNKNFSEIVEDMEKSATESQKSNNLSSKTGIKTDETSSLLDKMEQPKSASTNPSVTNQALNEQASNTRADIEAKLQIRHLSGSEIGSKAINVPNGVRLTITDTNGKPASYASGASFQWMESNKVYYNVDNPNEHFSADAMRNAVITPIDE